MIYKTLLLPFRPIAIILLLLTFIQAESWASAAFADITVKGKVTDKQGQPLPGVTVTVKGTAISTVTNDVGHYTIKVPDAKAVLVYRFISFLTEERTVGTHKELNVALTERMNDLDEVVVIGYGAEKKSDLTGSIASIKAEELTRTKSISFAEAMQGKIAGVQITSQSGEPGASVDVNIRGINSINAGSQPLYVIDGVMIDVNENEVASRDGNTASYNPLAAINAADIASIEVLKDASATAIYGARGANGVIIVTTRGESRKGASEVTANIATGVSSETKRMEVLLGQDYANYRYAKSPTSTYWGTDTDGNGSIDSPKDFSGIPYKDWQDATLRSGILNDHSFGYAARTSQTSFSTNFGYTNQQGIIKANKYERFSGRLNIVHNASKKLKLGANVNASYDIRTGSVSNGGIGTYNGLVQSFILYNPYRMAEDVESGIDPEDGGLSNPEVFLRDAYKKTPGSRVISSIYAEYKIGKYFTLRPQLSGTLTNSKNEEWYPSTTSWGAAANGRTRVSRNDANTWQSSNTLTYNRRLKSGHSFSGLLGIEASRYEFSSFATGVDGFELQIPGFISVNDIAQGSVISLFPTTDKYSITRFSQFGRLNYSYKQKYLLTATLRRDGSSVFGADTKYGYFPSASVAWRVSDEAFMKDLTSISSLKLRFSIGASGNDRIPPYRSLSRTDRAYYSSSAGSTTLGLASSSSANPDLKWETSYQKNLGLDLELFRGRISLTTDIYQKNTKDMLLETDVSSQMGSYKQWQNIGEIENKGFELAINTVNVKKGAFQWNTSFNFNINRNKVISLGSVSAVPVSVSGGNFNVVGRLAPGNAIGGAYGFVFDGIYQLSDFDLVGGNYVLKSDVVSINGRSVKPGDMKFKDLTNDGVVDDVNDKTFISNSNPKHFGGITNNFQYKNFDLSILFNWSYGNDILNIGKYRYEAYNGNWNVSRAYWENHWTAENPNNQYPSLSDNTGKIAVSTYYVEDGSYLRLRTVSLGYTLPANIVKQLNIKQCRFFVSGDNLYTWTKYSGFDPEVSSRNKLMMGLDYVSYPRSQTFTFGANITF